LYEQIWSTQLALSTHKQNEGKLENKGRR